MLGRDGWWAQILYLVLGGVGLPLFAGAPVGFPYLLGPTGGYLIGFVAGHEDGRAVHLQVDGVGVLTGTLHREAPQHAERRLVHERVRRHLVTR